MESICPRRNHFLVVLVAVLLLWCPEESHAVPPDKPNIIVVLADDLGYGDVHCFDPDHAKISTPNIDRLAEQGERFTDAHAGTSVCTPSRYAVLTGRFCWRSRLQVHVVGHYGTPVIAPDRLTLPKMLQQQGYVTACIGKWHLGWDWPLRRKDGSIARAPADKYVHTRESEGEPIFEMPIEQGPITRGFGYYFGVDVPNFPPFTFIENDRMAINPTDRIMIGTGKPGELVPAPIAPGWKYENILPKIVEKTEGYLAERAKDKKPFFLYMTLTSPHEPVAPSAEFKGKSGISPVADFIMQTDAALGRVMTALDKHGLAENTLLIFTSDNGHAAYTGLAPLYKVGHRVNGPYRGYKCNISDGGQRVPLVVRWPGVTPAGSVNSQLICLSDLMRTCADLLQVKLPDNSAEDSVSILPLLRGQDRPVREDLVLQPISSSYLAIRQGPWKLALCAGDAVWGGVCTEKGVPHDLGEDEARKLGLPPIQLYNMADDPGETMNLQAVHPEIVRKLHARLQKYVSEGRSTPGAPQANDMSVPMPPLPPLPKEGNPSGGVPWPIQWPK
ncbi:MAG: arylsulfatase [Verrucomicrobiae bacterium]